MQALFRGVLASARTSPLLFLSAHRLGRLRPRLQHYARVGALTLWEGILPGRSGVLLKPRLRLLREPKRAEESLRGDRGIEEGHFP